MFSRVSVTLAPCLDVQYFTQQYCSTLTFHVSSSCWASWSWLSSSVCITNTLMLLKKSTQLYTGGINVIFKSYLFISLLRIHISHSWQVETNVSRHRGLIPSWSSNSPAALLFIYLFIKGRKENKAETRSLFLEMLEMKSETICGFLQYHESPLGHWKLSGADDVEVWRPAVNPSLAANSQPHQGFSTKEGSWPTCCGLRVRFQKPLTRLKGGVWCLSSSLQVTFVHLCLVAFANVSIAV